MPTTDRPDRTARLHRLLGVRGHMEGCRYEDTADGARVEGFDATRPPNPMTGDPAINVAVVRCIDCGGQRTYVGEHIDTLLRR